jgi:outer membrane protein assembly factor BamB
MAHVPLIRKLPSIVLAMTFVLAASASAAATDWRQFRSDAAQTGENAAETTLSPATVEGLQTAWTKSVGEHIQWPAPIVVGNETIVTSLTQVAAFSTSTGRQLWTFDAPSGFLSNPIAASSSRVYISADEGPVFALDVTTGALLWQRELGGSFGGGPTVTGGVVYVPGGIRLHALDAATGTTVWDVVASQNSAANISTPAVSGGFVVVNTAFGARAFTQSSGEAVWMHDFPRFSNSGAAIVGNAVFAVAGRQVVKLDLATGEVIWRKWLVRGNDAVSAPAVGGGLVVVHIERNDPRREIVTARSADTGKIVWSVGYAAGTMRGFPESIPAIANGVVYAAFTGGQMRAFDAVSGKKLWESALDGPAFSSPSVANGQLEVGTFAGSLYAFRLP